MTSVAFHRLGASMVAENTAKKPPGTAGGLFEFSDRGPYASFAFKFLSRASRKSSVYR